MTYLLLLVAVTIWGATFVASKICLESMGPGQLVASRFLLAAPALLFVARLRGARVVLGPMTRTFALGAAVFSGHYLLQTRALEHTTATNTGWLVAVGPIPIAILAALFLDEPLRRSTGLGIALASAGVVLLVSRGELGTLGWLSSVGDWMALASTLTWALYTVITRDLGRAHDPVVVALVMTAPLAVGALGLPFVLESWTPVGSLSSRTLLALVFLGVGGVAVAQWFWQAGVAQLGATRAGLFLYLEPLVTTGLAVPILGESIGFATVAGGLLALSGVFVAQRDLLE